MSTIIVDEILDSDGGSINFVDGFTIQGNSLSNINFMRVIDSAGPPYDSAGQSGAYNGLLWYDDSSERMNILTPIGWKTLSGTITNYPVIANYYGDRAVVAGGDLYNAGQTTQINYFSIANIGNASDFGDLSTATDQHGSGSNGSIKVMFGGNKPGVGYIQDMTYITFSTLGNSQSFGTLGNGNRTASGASDGDLCVYAGDISSGSVSSNAIRYFAFTNFTSVSSFGNLQNYRGDLAVCSDGTYGTYAGGRKQDPSTNGNEIDYITIQTPSNATDFGDITVSARSGLRGCSDDTRGLHFGGGGTNIIEYITIAVPSNATDFGDLGKENGDTACASDGTYAFCSGGNRYIDSYYLYQESNVIEYVTIQTTGNATDFGDLLIAVDDASAESGN